MEEIINDILKAESEAEGILKEAREKDARMRQALENELSTALEEAHGKAQSIIQEKVSRAKNSVQEEYERAVEKEKERGREFLDSKKEQIASVIEEVVSLIVTPEYRRK